MSVLRTDRRKCARSGDPELRGRRAEPRAYMEIAGTAETLSGHNQVVLLDVSKAGARLEGTALPDTGKEIILKCGPIDTFGTVVWTASGRCGVAFDEPLDVHELIALRAAAASEARSRFTPEERQAAADWQSGLAR